MFISPLRYCDDKNKSSFPEPGGEDETGFKDSAFLTHHGNPSLSMNSYLI